MTRFGVFTDKCKTKSQKNTTVCKLQKKFITAPGSMKRKIGSLAVLGMGIFLATPPGIMPDDFLNILVAGLLVTILPVDPITALIISYTIVAWLMILGGALLFPGKTSDLITTAGRGIWGGIRDIKRPMNLLGFSISLFLMVFVLKTYSGIIASAGLI